MSLLEKMDAAIKQHGGLIVSCQPVPGSPLDKPDIVAAMALAAVQAGAVAVRIEGIENLKATRPLIAVPIIGIVKRDLDDSPVRITPYLEDVDALAQAGADIIAFDGTERVRPVAVAETIARIHHHQSVAMADCSSQQDAAFCHQLGADIIGTTLSGYTCDVVPKEPDLPLVAALSAKGYRVIAEGRFNAPAQAAQAMARGAWAVTVGSAITRLEHICQWYRDAIIEGAV
ncbi:N-acetylmannosamine-6-phosphate 2-epimerase [Kluyvera ascorbata]|uniref:N-acetylmannosamine-6-phosphate 2-epimerase n=1 Tax=Kluyvera ascorbata TaxID=51288 RepID=UPI0018A664C5|nr:putative N-acetylmannosamine-6-phosphate 2-epimerase [Kluyvera ascorbata]BCA41007.1 putative N-acetylmannosamine-6-phosphate 2-epimerase [Kluyvera ascorbata]HBL0731082.1 putative N-acetylmannosamine-6-phosphate 2-epimerase [Kluyvera ascorbata]